MPYYLTYAEDFPEKLIKHMELGYSFSTFGAVVGVTKTTLYEWVDKYPEFKEAKGIAFLKAQMFFEEKLVKKAEGSKGARNIDLNAVVFPLKTRFHEDYSDKKQEETGDQTFIFNLKEYGN